jgi:hypothetical protein
MGSNPIGATVGVSKNKESKMTKIVTVNDLVSWMKNIQNDSNYNYKINPRTSHSECIYFDENTRCRCLIGQWLHDFLGVTNSRLKSFDASDEEVVASAPRVIQILCDEGVIESDNLFNLKMTAHIFQSEADAVDDLNRPRQWREAIDSALKLLEENEML